MAAVCALALIIAGCSPGPEAPGTLAPEKLSSIPTPTAATAVHTIPTPTPIPPGRICNRTKSAQRAILLELGMESCRQPVMEDLGKIKKLRIARGPIIEGDLEGMNNLAKLEIVDLETPLGRNVLPSMPELRELTIQTREPKTGMRSPDTILTPGIFSGLPRLERLRVTGENGWNEEELTAELISGMPLLRRLELDYIRSIEPDALSQTPLLEYVRIHGAESWKDFAPRVPRELFAELSLIKHVEVRNFRWPPVLDVKNPEAACRDQRVAELRHPGGPREKAAERADSREVQPANGPGEPDRVRGGLSQMKTTITYRTATHRSWHDTTNAIIRASRKLEQPKQRRK